MAAENVGRALQAAAPAIAWSQLISAGTSVFSMASMYGWILNGQRSARIRRSQDSFAATAASTSVLNLLQVVPLRASALTTATAALNGAESLLYAVRAWAIVSRAGEAAARTVTGARS